MELLRSFILLLVGIILFIFSTIIAIIEFSFLSIFNLFNKIIKHVKKQS
jgi:hypothetical protein